MNKFFRACAVMAVSCAALLLNGCGGGGGGGTAPPAPMLSLLAGSIGGPGFIDGDGTNARFQSPDAIASDAQGNLLVMDAGLSRRVTPAGTVSTAGMSRPYPNADNVALQSDGTYWTVTSEGVHRVSASGDQFLALPGRAIAVDAQGNAYVSANCAVWKLTPLLAKSLVAGVENVCGPEDGPPGQGHFIDIRDIATDRHGTVYVLDAQGYYPDAPYFWATVRRIAADGTVTTIAGGEGMTAVDGNGLQARFFSPSEIAADGIGNVYVADRGGLRRIDPARNVTTVPLDGTGFYANDIAADEQGNLYVSRFQESAIRVVRPGSSTSSLLAGLPADGTRKDGQGADARFDALGWTALDRNGDVLVVTFSWTSGLSIRRVTPAGVVTTEVARPIDFGSDIAPRGHAFDPGRGVHYFNVTNLECPADYCIPRGSAIWRLSADGSLAEFAGSSTALGTNDGTGTAARFSSSAVGPVMDPQGNLYVADGYRLRKITPEGVVSTIAQQIVPANPDLLVNVQALGVDANGTAYVLGADWVLRKISPQGQVTDIAGASGQAGYVDGVGTAARFQVPSTYQMTLDSVGNIYLAEHADGPTGLWGDPGSVRKVTPDGTVSTIAGQVNKSGILLGPLPAQLYSPSSVLWTPNGLVIGSGWALLRIVQ